MTVLNESLLLGDEGGAGYVVERSLRFSSIDSAYLSRTPASAGNRKTWTWAGWVKRSGLGANGYLFEAGASDTASARFIIRFSSDNTLLVTRGQNTDRITSQVFRDVSAWCHLVVAVDTTQATANDRIKIYFNGTQITAFSSTSNPGQNDDLGVNAAAVHAIGRSNVDNGDYFNGYLADVHFIDGQALDPSAFTAVSATTGRLEPKQYAGSFGTNGFWLKFSDNSAATATTLGKDYSGNSNNWTPNNLSISTSFFSVSPVPSYPQDAFNGVTSDYAYGGSTSVFTLSPSAAVVGGRIDMIGRTSSNYTYKAITNAGTFTLSEIGDWPGVGGTYGKQYSVTNGSITTLLGVQVEAAAGNWTLAGVQVAGDPATVGTQLLVYAYGVPPTDSLVDTPTSYGTDTGAGGEVRGNYATWNPNNYSSAYFSDGNLKFAPTSGYNETAKATMAIGDKCYFEVTILSPNTAQNYLAIGLMRQETQVLSGPTAGYNISVGASGNYTGSVAYFPYGGTVNYNGSSVVTGLSTCTVGDVVGISYDPSNGQVKVYKNGVALNSGNAVYTLSTAYSYAPAMTEAATNAYYVNFGQRQWAYAAPAGCKALCDTNLPTPVVAKPSEVMDVALYTGTGSSNGRTVGFSPDLVWIKPRSNANPHQLFDRVRGDNARLKSNATDAEYTYSAGVGLTFDASGFTVGTDNGLNQSGETFVAWTWDAGSSTVTNTQGSITSQVRANASAGFSVVTYTVGNNTSQTIGHGLNVAPQLIIVKERNQVNNWQVYHASLGNGSFLYLNATNASASNNLWNNTSPTSTVFSIRSGGSANFYDGKDQVAYCFAPVAGYSSFGSYTGNGSTDGPFVYTGMRARWILLKRTDTNGDWILFDAARDPKNVCSLMLFPNTADGEFSSATYLIDILSNGFKLRQTGPSVNASSGSFVYAAFAENPFQYARAR